MGERAVSVIIPTHNRRAMVVEAVASVLAQTPPPLEVVVVDDGSTDGTGEALALRFGPAIRYIFQANGGPGAARNRGVAEARGNWLAFLDSDDLWAPDRLAVGLADAEEGTLGFAGVSWFRESDGAAIAPESLGVRWPRYDVAGRIVDPVLDVAEGRYLHLGTLLCSRTAFLTVGRFDEGLRMGEDEDWFARAALLFPFRYLDRPLLRRRFHPGQLSLESEGSLKSLIAVFSAMAERTRETHPRACRAATRRLADKYSHLANHLLAEARRQEARRAMAESWRLDRPNFKRLLKLLAYA